MRHLLLMLTLLCASTAHAVIGFDAASEATGTTTFSWTHTPVGTAKGIAVCVFVNTAATDVISGVTYGGTAMAQVASAGDSAGEPGFTECYFLGASIPTGAQTVQVTVSSGTTAKHAVAVSVTSSSGSNTQLVGTAGTIATDTANPSITVSTITGPSFGFAGIFSGQNAEGSTTAGTDETIRHSHDFGTQTTAMETSTTQQSSGNQVLNFTMAIEDTAMVAFAIEQTTADPAGTPARRTVTIE